MSHDTLHFIKNLLGTIYPEVDFLEDEQKRLDRFEYGKIIIFALPDKVIKYYHYREGNAQAVLKKVTNEVEIIRSFRNHPNVVRVFDSDELQVNGRPVGAYFVMERFGMLLSGYLAQRKHFNTGEVVDFLQQVGDALESAHYRINPRIIHADLKPSNIGLRFPGNRPQYVLMDFDVATNIESKEKKHPGDLSHKAGVKGFSPEFAPPEQIVASSDPSVSISNRVDLYALGVVGLLMYTGKMPHKKDPGSNFAVPPQLLDHDPLKEVFDRLCAPDPAQRPKTVSEALLIGKDRSEHTVKQDYSAVIEDEEEKIKRKKTEPVRQKPVKIHPALFKYLYGFLFAIFFFAVGVWLINAINTGKQTARSDVIIQSTPEKKSIKIGDYQYDGDLVNGLPDGYGIQTYPDGKKYEGFFRLGKRDGKGIMNWPGGEMYDGEWKNDRRDGKGTFTLANGERYEGMFSGDLKNGYGKYRWADNSMYEGYWENDLKNGAGTMTWSNGDTYSGDWRNDEMDGRGVLKRPGGQQIRGTWKGNRLINNN